MDWLIDPDDYDSLDPFDNDMLLKTSRSDSSETEIWQTE